MNLKYWEFSISKIPKIELVGKWSTKICDSTQCVLNKNKGGRGVFLENGYWIFQAVGPRLLRTMASGKKGICCRIKILREENPAQQHNYMKQSSGRLKMIWTETLWSKLIKDSTIDKYDIRFDFVVKYILLNLIKTRLRVILDCCWGLFSASGMLVLMKSGKVLIEIPASIVVYCPAQLLYVTDTFTTSHNFKNLPESRSHIM